MNKRQLTRWEITRRKYRIIYLLSIALWAAILLAALFYGMAIESEPVDEPEVEAVADPPKEAVVVQVIPAPTVAAVPASVAEAEAVSMERDPVREDIPLSAENQRLLWQACEETGVTYELALAVIWKETDFRNIKGDDGKSAGYMQVQPQWHGDRMEKYGVTDLMDPYSNFLVGCDYLAELAEKDRGIEWMLHAYNGGMSYANKLAKAGKVSQYARTVLTYINILTTEEI